MKKLLFSLVMVAGMLSITQAQTFKQLGVVAGDTIVTSSSKDTVSKIIPVTAGYSTGAIKVEYTKTSGTVSLKAYLYPGDGTDFESAATDSSAAFSDASGYVFFTKTSWPYSHYKVQIRAANGANTTQNVPIKIKTLFKRFDD